MQQSHLFWVKGRRDSQVVMALPRRSEGKLGSFNFKNASGQEVTHALGPGVF